MFEKTAAEIHRQLGIVGADAAPEACIPIDASTVAAAERLLESVKDAFVENQMTGFVGHRGNAIRSNAGHRL